MTTAAEALVAVNQIVGLTDGEKQYLMTVARGEGGFGSGWDNPSAKTVAESAQFGLTGHEGKDSNNWGAIQGVGNAGSFFHVDHHKDGSVYKGTFRKYKTNTDAALDIAKVLLKPNVKAALKTGSLRKAVFAQHSNGYFELDPEQYLKAVLRNYSDLTKTLKWPAILSENGNASSNPPLSPGPGVEPGGGLQPAYSSSEPDTIASLTDLPIISLERKSRGPAVLMWQKYLKTLGMAVQLTSVFDSQTDSFTRLYQSNRRSTAIYTGAIDGDVGPKTWSTMFS